MQCKNSVDCDKKVMQEILDASAKYSMLALPSLTEYFPVSSNFLDLVEPEIKKYLSDLFNSCRRIINERDKAYNCQHSCKQNIDKDRNNTKILHASVKNLQLALA